MLVCVTVEGFSVKDSASSELIDDLAKLEGVTKTVLFFCVILVALLCVIVVLFIRADENLTVVVLDPTVE